MIKRKWFTIIIASVLICCGTSKVFAARVVNSATFAGSDQVTVLSEATVSATVNVTTSKWFFDNNDNWGSTGWTIGTASPVCENHSPPHNSSGTYDETFNIIAPATPGSYDVSFTAYSAANCAKNPSTTLIQVSGITVESLTPLAPTLEYRFDECFWDGSLGEVEETVSGLDAVAINGATTEASDLSGGGICSSGKFSGSNYVDAGDVANNVFGTTSNAFTITAWVRPTALATATTNHNTANTFLAKASDGYNDNLEIGINANGSLHVYIDTKSKDKYADIGTGVTTLDRWYFVALRYDSGSVTVQINNNSYTSTTWSGGGNLDAAVGSPLTVGSSQHIDNYFQGNIDEVKVFATAITDEQIGAIYSNELAGNNYDGSERVCKCLSALAEYRFDECDFSTGVVDSSGNGHTGVAQGDTLTSDIDSMVCRGAVFDGTGDYIELQSFPDLTGSFSITGWFKSRNNSQVGQRIFADDESDNNGYAISFNDVGTSKVRFFDRTQSGSGIIDSSVTIQLDHWYFVAAVADANSGKRQLYVKDISGTSDYQESQFTSVSARDTGNASIGGETDASAESSFKLTGAIDELKVFDRALTAEEITSIFSNEKDGFDADGSERSCPCCINYAGAITPVHFEGGAMVIKNTYSSDKTWSDIVFNQPFQTVPEVFIVLEKAGSDPANVRVKDITTTGFKAAILEPQGEDGPHVAQTVNFFAVNQGVHKIGDQYIEVGEVSISSVQQASRGTITTNEWTTVTPQVPFCNPVVVANIQSMNNETSVVNLPTVRSIPWLTTAVTAEDGAVKLALERSETSEGNIGTTERVGYMIAQANVQDAFVDDLGTDIKFETIKTNPLFVGWDDSCRSVSFVNSYSKAPLIAANKNSHIEADGGWFRRCALSASSVGFQVDEDRYTGTDGSNSATQDSERKHAAEVGGIFVFSDNFVLTQAGPDHYEITHDGQGLTCAPETVTIKACADSACSSQYLGAVTLFFSPTDTASEWVGGDTQTVTFAGVPMPFQLYHTSPGDVKLGVLSEPAAQNSAQYFNTSGATADVINFADTGFLIEVEAGHSCTALSGTIKAVDTDTLTGACTADGSFAGKSKNIGFWFGYADPVTGAMQPQIGTTTLNTTSPGTIFSLLFNSSAEASFALSYNDAGSINVYARYEGSSNGHGHAYGNSLVMLGSTIEPVVFVPHHFELQATNPDTVEVLNNNSDAGSTIYPAAMPFTLAVQAVCANGDVTPNFKALTALNIESFQPSAGSVGTFAPTQIPEIKYVNGVATLTSQASYDEVGWITLKALHSNYLSSGLDVSDTTDIGRFVPDHFSVGVLEHGAFEPFCNGFSYVGKGFGYQIGIIPELEIIAQNTLDVTTANYRDNFVKLTSPVAPQIVITPPGSDIAQVGIDGGTPLLALSWSSATRSLTNNNDGTLNITLGAADVFTYTHEHNALVAPFDTDIQLVVAQIKDSDGVTTIDTPAATFTPTSIEQRFGRIRMENCYGSELLPLSMPIYTEYFDGYNFVANSQDSCSMLLFTNFSFTKDPITNADPVLNQVVGGVGSLLWNAPPYSVGTIDVDLNLTSMPWLQFDWDGDGSYDNDPPTARATFGIYKGSESIIYLRETTWR